MGWLDRIGDSVGSAVVGTGVAHAVGWLGSGIVWVGDEIAQGADDFGDGFERGYDRETHDDDRLA